MKKNISVLIYFLFFIIIFFYSSNNLFAFSTKDKIVAATYYYYFNNESSYYNKIFNDDINFYFTTRTKINECFVDIGFNSKEWFRGEIKNMTAAGINIVAPLFLSDQYTDVWNKRVFPNLLDTLTEMEKEGFQVPKIAVFFDPYTLYLEGRAKQNFEQSQAASMPESRLRWFLEQAEDKRIEVFYSFVKRSFLYLTGTNIDKFNSSDFDPKQSKYFNLWAMYENSPIIFIKNPISGVSFSNPSLLFNYISEQFEKDFHLKPILFPDYSWFSNIPIDTQKTMDVNIGGFIKWGTANYEPYAFNCQSLPFKNIINTIQIGAGYNDRGLKSISRNMDGIPLRSRDNGYFFSYAWQYALRTNAQLVMLETWNGIHEGTQLNHSDTTQRKYIHLNKSYVEKLNRDYSKAETVWCNIQARNFDNCNIINDEDGLYQVDGGVYRSRQQPLYNYETDYAADVPSESNGKTVPVYINNKMIRRTQNPQSQFFYFDINDPFANNIKQDEDIFVTVFYYDKGSDKFRIMYKQKLSPTSQLPTPNPQSFFFSDSIKKTDTSKIKFHTFKLSKLLLNNSIAQEINYYNYVNQGCDFAIDSMNDGDEFIYKVIVSKTSQVIIADYEQLTYPAKDLRFKIFITKDGSIDTTYNGNIIIECNDKSALKDIKYNFSKKDKGQKIFNLRFNKAGVFNLSIRDSNNPKLILSNQRVIVQRFKMKLLEAPAKGKMFRIWFECLDDDGKISNNYDKEILFNKINFNDEAPQIYTFSKEDEGTNIFYYSISSYGKFKICVEELNNPDMLGFLDVELPAPKCSLIPSIREMTLSGLKNNKPADGRCDVMTKNKKPCWMIPVKEQIKNYYLYFNISDALYHKLPTLNDIYILIKYLDYGSGEFYIEYDSNDTSNKVEGFKPLRNQKVKMSGTNKWKTAIFYLEDAYFGNRTNGGDFRIVPSKDDIFIHQVTVLPEIDDHPKLRKNNPGLIRKICSGFFILAVSIILILIARKIMKITDADNENML